MEEARAPARGHRGARRAPRPRTGAASLERLYRLDPGLIARLRADRLGLLDRMRVQQALKRRLSRSEPRNEFIAPFSRAPMR